VSIPHIIYALLGAFIVLFGMFSLFLRERLYVGEAIWAFIFGVIIGPYCAGIFDPRSWASGNEETDNLITLEFTRIVLAIGVFAIGVELPKAYMKKHWKSLFFLLVPVMTWGWFVSAALIFALIPGLNFLSSLAVAACLTPTDPILAAAVVGGKWADKHVPAHIRHLLAAESACNDGAAFPFLYLALYLTIDNSIGKAIKDWFLSLWLYQVILGSIIGCLLGYSFRHLMKFCQRHDLIDRNSYVAQYVSLTMLTIGVTTLLGSDELLAAFFCGTAFAWDGFFNKQTEESVFSSVMDTLFNVAAFIYVGAWMPFNKFQDAELTLSVWRLIVIAILVLLLRRLPITILLYKFIPDIKTFREAMFTGHFGPMGIGAVFISTLAVMVLENANSNADADASSHRAPTAQTILLEQTIQPIVAFMVLCSIAVHGLSIPSFSLGRRMHSVSRTWSRRDTLGSTRTGPGGRLPEWANQARMVSRAEDVVVNRDPGADLERGDSVLEKEKQDEEKEQEQELGSSSGTTAAESVHTMEGVEEEMEGSGLSAPPDGPEQVREWMEGNQKVIERRSGPGDDVRVFASFSSLHRHRSQG
ncbi:Sodium/hydrogen exchanger family-domain-containing protein, partial [Gymnopilus junonius]